jgi:hypothetical protein
VIKRGLPVLAAQATRPLRRVLLDPRSRVDFRPRENGKLRTLTALGCRLLRREAG